MPRRSKPTRRRRRNRSSADVIRVSFTQQLVANLASGLYNTDVYPGFAADLLAIADVYQFYRFSSLSYRLMPAQGSMLPAGAQTAVFIPGVVDTPSGGQQSSLAQLRHHVTLTPRCTVPTRWARLPRSVLMSYQPWFKTIAGTPSADTEYQGKLFIAGNGTDSFHCEIKGVCEFRQLVVAGMTPMLSYDQRMLREKQRLLSILSFSPTSLPAPAAPSWPGASLDQEKIQKPKNNIT